MRKYQRTQFAEVVKVEELLGMDEKGWPRWLTDKARVTISEEGELRVNDFSGRTYWATNGYLLNGPRVVWRSEADFEAEGWKEVEG